MKTGEFCAALVAELPQGPVPPEHDYYGRLIGSWDFEWIYHRGMSNERRIPGEWYFAWIIEGQALQDVFICPSRDVRGDYSAPEAEYGTTIRVYKPSAATWEIAYFTKDGTERFTVHKAESGDIVQDCVSCEGFLMRWIFSDISNDSFHWSNKVSKDEGLTWSVVGELFATRRP